MALENFTATGRWRDHDDAADAPINASTALPSGKPITGSVELTAALLEREDQLVQALAHKLMMYAVGRELEYFDMPQVRAVVQARSGRGLSILGDRHGHRTQRCVPHAGRCRASIRFSSGVFGGNGRERVRRVRRVAAMFLTKKYLSRRTVLQAAGVSLGLPFLDAMIPAGTALAQTAAAPKLRAGFFYLPHGAIMWNTVFGAEMDHWTPSGAGADFKLSPILEPLEANKRYVTSFGNIENRAPQGSVHTLVPATWLSGVRPDQKATGALMAPTIDQMIAAQIGQDSVLPSLEVSSETTIQSAACGSGACYYSSTLAFRDTTTPLPMEFNPRKVFVQLFGAGDTPEERATISRRRASVLDMINERTHELQGTLGAQDRAILDAYLESVRETERRIAKASERDLTGSICPMRRSAS